MKTIVELACEAGFMSDDEGVYVNDRDGVCQEEVERLIALVRADEREACADAVRFADNGTEAAEIIRARGNT
jgi:hypothetical protein